MAAAEENELRYAGHLLGQSLIELQRRVGPHEGENTSLQTKSALAETE
jgi:hypothetical protein